MSDKPLSRRRLLRRSVIVGAAAAGALAVPGGRADAAPASTNPPECVLDLMVID